MERTSTRTFVLDKKTKNTVRFQEVPVDDKIMIGPVYVQKEFLGDDHDTIKEIEITVSVKSG